MHRISRRMKLGSMKNLQIEDWLMVVAGVCLSPSVTN